MGDERKTAIVILFTLTRLLEERGKTSDKDIFGCEDGDIFYKDCENTVTDIIKAMGV